MNYLMNNFSKNFHAVLITLLLFLAPFSTASAQEESATTGNVMALKIEGVVSAIDLESREISLTVVMGLVFTVFIPESVDLEGIKVGDKITGMYFTAAEIELREPTAEELADPWVIVEEGELAKDGDELDAGAARVVRAVVTVSIIEKANERIAVTDSRGKTHFLMSVEPEKLAKLAEGQKIVVVFSEATLVTLEKNS
jgi:hypothetical protein